MPLTDPTVQNAASVLLASLTNSGCQQTSDPAVQAFQVAYISNGGTLPAAATAANGADGYYGAATSAALQAALDAGTVQPPPNAPAGCVGAASSSGGGGNTIAPIVVTGSPAPNYLPWVLGGLVVVAGSFAAYTYSKKHRGGKRRR